MTGSTGRRFDATLKHLVNLRDAKMVTTRPDPTDKRRMLYELSPNVKVSDSAEGRALDFGCCIVRV